MADDQTDLNLVVEKLDVRGLDDRVKGPVDRTGCLAKEGEWDRLWIHSSTLDVGSKVRHLRHHAAGNGHRRDWAKAVDGHRAGVVFGGGDGRPVGQQLTSGSCRRGDSCCAVSSLDPPAFGGSKDWRGHELPTFRG